MLHLLHYIPERRGQAFDVIEDVIPIFDLSISVRNDMGIEKVLAVPSGVELESRKRDGRIEFTLPELSGHQMVCLSY